MKKCNKCGIDKELKDFYSGRNSCKECKLKQQKEYDSKKLLENLEKGIKKCVDCGFEGELLYFLKHENKCKECGKKIYYDTKEKYDERRKNYRSTHKEERKEYWDNYYKTEENKKKVLEKGKNNYQKNKDNKNNKSKIYYKENKEKILLRCKKYESNNKERRRNRQKERLLTDPLFKLTRSLRGLTKFAFKGKGLIKNTKTEKLLGCSFGEFKLYLESKFHLWMTNENYGKYNGEFNYGWDIDHVKPLSSIDNNLPDEEKEIELIKLCHYTNLQPLCSKINREIKRDIINWKMDEI